MARMDTMEEPKARRKFHLQWSLATMVSVVIVYGALWTITNKWGVERLKSPYRDLLSKMKSVRFEENNSGFLLKNSFGKEGKDDNTILFTSPAPFVVSFQTSGLCGTQMERYHWFFGYTNAPSFEPVEELIDAPPEVPTKFSIDEKAKSDTAKE